MILKQFVPREVCLSCGGCCRFKEKDSLWRPKLTNQESLSDKIFSKNTVDSSGRVKTKCRHGEFFCHFLNPENNHCGVYGEHPFECQLYPFLIVKENHAPSVFAHHHCPYVQKTRHTKEFEDYAAYLKGFFSGPPVPDLSPADDYREHRRELEYLFSLGDGKNEKLLLQKPLFDEYLKKTAFEASCFSFVSLYAWRDFFDFEFRLIDENLCIFAKNEIGTFLYLPPLGKTISRAAVETAFNIMEQSNNGNSVTRIENVSEEQLVYFPAGQFRHFKKADEYVYRREDVALFKGNDFKSKRFDYNHFVEHHSPEFMPFEETMAEDCRLLYDQWAENRLRAHQDPVYRQMIEENRRVHQLVIADDRKLGLAGRVVLSGGKLCGYTFGFPLNDRVFCILFEITDLAKKGSAVYTFREFCRDKEVVKFPLINAMDDFGIENINKTKMSFRPSKTIPLYTVSKKDR